jgi:hydroxyacylglutathione hydrolase
MDSSLIDFAAASPVPVNLDVSWMHGAPPARRSTDPKIQAHACDPHTFVLRQSKTVHYEAPFLYLFCGNDRALLLDTGATPDPAAFPLRETVDAILEKWLSANPRDCYELVVAHFIIFNGPCVWPKARQTARLMWGKVRGPGARA